MQHTEHKWCRRRLKALMPIAFLALAGCYTYQDPTPTRREVPELQVHPVYFSHTIRFNALDNRPASLELEQLAAFLNRINAGRRDVLEIRYLDGPIRQRQAEILQALLNDDGYRAEIQAIHEGDLLQKEDMSDVTVAVRKAVVRLPDCPNWSDVPGRKYDNTAFSNFGCATVTNLGLMVDNPEDLLVGQSTTTWDGTRAASAVQRYQERETEPLLKEETSTSAVGAGESGG